MSVSQAKKYAIIGGVALVAVAIANRVAPVKKVVYGS